MIFIMFILFMFISHSKRTKSSEELVRKVPRKLVRTVNKR